MTALVKAAKAEGKLNLIADPRNWANYGAIMDGFTKKYHIKINDENPLGSSAEEITAITQDTGRSSDPDWIDVGENYAVGGVTSHLLAAYKVHTWNEIPAGAKNSNGYWANDYGGFVSIGCNSKALGPNNQPITCPTTFAQMAAATSSSGYKICMNNSPTVAEAALVAVMTASTNSGGSLDSVAQGVTLFATLHKNGTYVPVVAEPAQIADGTCNILLWYDYLNVADFTTQAGWTVTIPSNSVGVYYATAINKNAPDPAAARLWAEYCYSVIGQNDWLGGGARPIELTYMIAHGTANTKLTAALPTLPATSPPIFPSQTQLTNAATYITSNWASAVGG